MDGQERVLTISRSLIDPLCGDVFTTDVEPIRAVILERAEFLERGKVEQDLRYKQIIPYVVLRHGDKYLLIRRTPKQAEARLHDKYSLGVGGHINALDLSQGDLLDSGMRRELNEEIKVHEGTCRMAAIINDDTTEVDRVHLAVVYLLECRSPEFANMEPEAYTAEWQTPEEIAKKYASLESWSKIVFDRMARRAI
jgi:predicted NUDIX family phosphoesterase